MCVNSLKLNCPLSSLFPFLLHSLYFVFLALSHPPLTVHAASSTRPSAVLLTALYIAIPLCCPHKLVNHGHKMNQFFLHYKSCALQFSKTSHTLKELLNHSLVYPHCPVCPKLIGVEEKERHRVWAWGEDRKRQMSVVR